MLKESWVGELYETCPYEYVYPGFLSHIEPMEISPDLIKGKVLIIGHGPAFPEKTLVCLTETRYQQLRPEVEAIYLCDSGDFSDPSLHLDISCVNTISMDTLPECEQNTAYWEPVSSYYFLNKAPKNYFDTVMMFRAVDTGAQITENGMVTMVAQHLKVGGHAIFSGGRFPETVADNLFFPLKLIKLTNLPNYSDGFPFSRNMGVILQK